MKFNITLIELMRAVEIAKKKGFSEHRTVTMEVDEGNGLGFSKKVSPSWNDEFADITDYGAF